MIFPTNFSLFNGTETVTTFEIPISAFFLNNEGEQLINATGKSFQGEASEIVKGTTSAHEQEILDIVKQFKSTRRKRFLSRILSKFAHVGRRLYPRAESTLSKSSIPQKTFEGTKFAIKSSSTGIHVEKIVRGAKWAAKTSAQLGALYGATVIYDKLTGSSENFALLKNATNFTLIKSTIDSSLNYAKNEKIHDLKMLLFFQKLNHLPFIVDYLKAIQSGWTDVERIHIKDDKIIVETKTKFYSISGKYCEKHFIGTFENGYYSYNSTSQFIDEKEVQNCDENMFEEMFCFSKTFNSPPLNVSVNHCYRRRTKSKIIFVTNTDKYLKNDIQYDYPLNGILVTSLKEKCELAIPLCGKFSLRHNEEHFHSYQKDLNTEEIIKMSQKLEEIEKKATDNQMFFTKLAKLLENDFLIKICLGIIMIAVTASILFCLLYINFICFCKKAIPKIRGR
uniref:Envelope protein n=1 Tax=Panagrolaimus sp. PS1159 TaxID=55785 RepID=A0AC35GN25_9BILA